MAGLPIYRQTSLFERHFKGKHQSFSSEDDSCSDQGSEDGSQSSRQSSCSNDHFKNLEESKAKKVHYQKQEERVFEESRLKSGQTKNGQSNFKSKKGMKVEGYRRSSLMRDFCYFRSEQEFQFLQMQNESFIAWRKFQNAPVSEPKNLQNNKNNRNSTYFRQQIYIKAPSQNVFSLRDLQIAQGQKIEEDFPHVMQVRSALRRKSCICKECGVLDSKQIKTKDVRYVPTQHRQLTDTKQRISNILVTPRKFSQRNSSLISDPQKNINQVHEPSSSSQFIPSESMISRVSNSIPGSLACLGDQSIDRGKKLNQNISQKTPPRKVSQSYSSNSNSKPSKVQVSQKDTLRQNKQNQNEHNTTSSHRILKYSQDFKYGNTSLPKIDVQTHRGEVQMNKQASTNTKSLLEQTLNEKTNSFNGLSLLKKKLSENSSESTQNQHEMNVYSKKIIVNKQQGQVIYTGGHGSQRLIIEEYANDKIAKKFDNKNEKEDQQILNQNQTTRVRQGINKEIHHVSIESLMNFRDRYLREFQEKKKKTGKKISMQIESITQDKQTNHNQQQIRTKSQRELSPVKLLKDELIIAGKIQIFDNSNNKKENQLKQQESGISALKQQEEGGEDSKQTIIDKIKIFSKNHSRFIQSSQYKRQTDSKLDNFTEKNGFTNKQNSFQKLFQTQTNSSTMHFQERKINVNQNKRALLLSFPTEMNNQQERLSTSMNIKKSSQKPKTLIIQRNSQDFNSKQNSTNLVISSVTSSDDTTATTTVVSALPFHSQEVIQHKVQHTAAEHHQRKNVSLSDFTDGTKNLFNKFSCYYQSVSKNNGIISKTSSVPMFTSSLQRVIVKDQIGRNKQKINTSIIKSFVWQ